MGKLKGIEIDNMNVHEMQEYLNGHRASHDIGYIKFLEEQLEKAELLINKIKDMAEDEIIVTIQDSMVGPFIDSYYDNKK